MLAFQWGAVLIGLGAVLSGAGAFATGLAALRAAKREPGEAAPD